MKFSVRKKYRNFKVVCINRFLLKEVKVCKIKNCKKDLCMNDEILHHQEI
jgi:hypothetical protein